MCTDGNHHSCLVLSLFRFVHWLNSFIPLQHVFIHALKIITQVFDTYEKVWMVSALAADSLRVSYID